MTSLMQLSPLSGCIDNTLKYFLCDSKKVNHISKTFKSFVL